jgi:molecular chaperone DnaJ
LAGPDEIRAAYRRHAARLHPDRNADPKAADQFREVTKAYEDLASGPSLAGPGFVQRTDAKDAMDAVASIVDSFLSGILGANAPGRAARLADIRLDLRLTRRQAAAGDTVDLQVLAREACSHCEGTGLHPGHQCRSCSGKGSSSATILGIFGVSGTCVTCSGTGHGPCIPCLGVGLVTMVRELVVRVPAGITEGIRLRFAGQGDLDPRSGFRGDLLCDVRIIA